MRYIADAVFDKILRVAEPHVGAVGKTGYLHKVGKVLRLCIYQHLLDEARTHFGQSKRTYHKPEHFGILVVYVHLRYAKRLGGHKQLVDRAVVHCNVHYGYTAVFLKELVLCGNIVSQLVELEDCIVQI